MWHDDELRRLEETSPGRIIVSRNRMVTIVSIPDGSSATLLALSCLIRVYVLLEGILHGQKSAVDVCAVKLNSDIAGNLHIYAFASLMLVDSAVDTALACLEGGLSGEAGCA